QLRLGRGPIPELVQRLSVVGALDGVVAPLARGAEQPFSLGAAQHAGPGGVFEHVLIVTLRTKEVAPHDLALIEPRADLSGARQERAPGDLLPRDAERDGQPRGSADVLDARVGARIDAREARRELGEHGNLLRHRGSRKEVLKYAAPAPAA